MPFLKQTDYKNIIAAKRDGNPKALAIIQTYLKGGSQDDLDRMVFDFYNPTDSNPPSEEAKADEIASEIVEDQEAQIGQQPVDEAVQATEAETPEGEAANVGIADLTDVLDKDLDGLIDLDEINEQSFEDFLDEKKKNANRLAKGADHFKMYDADGRAAYLASKEDEYGKSFDVKRKDIDRAFRDMDGAIAAYSQCVGDLPDDGIDLDSSVSANAYSDLIDSQRGRHSFGRPWDEEDMADVKVALGELVAKYGKQNVAAALNTIRGDNASYRDMRNGRIDSAIKNHNRQLEDLLK